MVSVIRQTTVTAPGKAKEAFALVGDRAIVGMSSKLQDMTRPIQILALFCR
jgi:hypothetical protein